MICVRVVMVESALNRADNSQVQNTTYVMADKLSHANTLPYALMDSVYKHMKQIR